MDKNKLDLQATATIDIEAAAEGDAPKQPTFKIVAYTGGVMAVGWGNPVVIDVSGLHASGLVTVLKDHDPAQIVGQGVPTFSTRKIAVRGKITGDTETKGDPAEQILMHHKNGFQWAASVGVSVERFEEVEAGVKVKVNGQNFIGPLDIVRAGRLGEVSFVPVGADEKANAQIAAKQGGRQMATIQEWTQEEHGVAFDGLIGDAKVEMEAAFAAATGAKLAKKEPDPAPKKTVEADADVNLKAEREKDAAEVLRKAKIKELCGDEHPKLCAAALLDGRDPRDVELHIVRTARPPAPNIQNSVPHDLSPMVLEAALLMHAHKLNEKDYPVQVLEAAHKQHKGGIGLRELVERAAFIATGRTFKYGTESMATLKAAFSTRDLAEILSNVGNKFLLRAYEYGENADLAITATTSVKDFKTKTSYRLAGNGEMVRVAPGGQIEHGTLADQAFTIAAATYGIMYGIPRTDLINDDLGAFDGLMTKIGIGAGQARQTVFWTAFLANTGSFFGSGNSNVTSGAGSALDIDAISEAQLVMRQQTDPGGKIISLVPKIMLVPATLEPTARNLFLSQKLENTTASTETLTTNIYFNRYNPVSSVYLDSTGIENASSTAWYLLADPNLVPVIETCYLNGVTQPTIDSADADFNTLGIQVRGYFDFGVALQDPRAGVRAAGA